MLLIVCYQFAQFIERERSAMEERIQVYTAHQHQLFSDLQNRALSERNVLLYQTTLTERKSVAIEVNLLALIND